MFKGEYKGVLDNTPPVIPAFAAIQRGLENTLPLDAQGGIQGGLDNTPPVIPAFAAIQRGLENTLPLDAQGGI